MKLTSHIVVITLALSIIFYALGKYFFVHIFVFFEPTITGISFQITGNAGKIKTAVLFGLLLATIPVFTILVWRFAPVVSVNRKIATVFTVLIFIAGAIFIRQQEVKAYFNYLLTRRNLLNGQSQMNYPIDPVNFVYYMFGGLFTGCIISFFLFRRRKVKRSTA